MTHFARSFIVADVDYDGRIGLEEFDAMIEAAASLPRKYGYSWWVRRLYSLYCPVLKCTVSVLGREEGYTVKYTPPPEGVPEGEA